MAVAQRLRDWRARPTRPRFWREFAYVLVFELVYEWTSDRAGTSRTAAYRHALDQVRIERALGLFQEHRIQTWALPHRVFVEMNDLYYATVHWVMPVVALIWVFRTQPARYLRWRDALAWTTALALVCFAVFPVMPPRLLPSSYGVIDTMARIGGPGSWDTVLLKDAGNQYAAMPSLHISWALWSVLALYPVVRRRWVKVLLLLDIPATVVAILVTGNHYIVDIFGGLAVLAIGWALALVTPRFLPRTLAGTTEPAPTPESGPVPAPAPVPAGTTGPAGGPEAGGVYLHMNPEKRDSVVNWSLRQNPEKPGAPAETETRS